MKNILVFSIVYVFLLFNSELFGQNYSVSSIKFSLENKEVVNRKIGEHLFTSDILNKIEVLSYSNQPEELYSIPNTECTYNDSTCAFPRSIWPYAVNKCNTSVFKSFYCGDTNCISSYMGAFNSIYDYKMSKYNGLLLSTNVGRNRALESSPIPFLYDTPLFDREQLLLYIRDGLFKNNSIINLKSNYRVTPLDFESNLSNYRKSVSRFNIFRDLLLTRSQLIEYPKFNLDKDSIVDYNCNINNVTFYRVVFKVRENVNIPFNIYFNYRLFTNESNFKQQRQPDCFSIRFKTFSPLPSCDDPSAIISSRDDIVGFPINPYIRSGYRTIPDEEIFSRTSSSPISYNQLFSIPSFYRVANQKNDIPYKYSSMVYSYQLKTPLEKGKVYSILVGVADMGDYEYNEKSSLLVQVSDKPFKYEAKPQSTASFDYTGNCCNYGFAPFVNKEYIFQAWVKVDESVTNSSIQLSFAELDQNTIVIPVNNTEANSEGWVRINHRFMIPQNAQKLIVRINNQKLKDISQANKDFDLDYSTNLYVDDVRIIPIHSDVKSFVYDSVVKRKVAEFDTENFAIYYDYDEFGKLIQTKKETSKGVKNLKISTSNE